jgi:hypothetical protein
VSLFVYYEYLKFSLFFFFVALAVDRTVMNSLKEARDAMTNVAIDYLQAYSQNLVSAQKNNALMSPSSLRLIPLYALALMKNVIFYFILFFLI